MPNIDTFSFDNYGINVALNETFLPGDFIVFTTNPSFTSSLTTPAYAAGVRPSKAGKYRVTFTLSGTSAGTTSNGRIYVNGVPRSAVFSTVGFTPVDFFDDIEVEANDLIGLYIYVSSGGAGANSSKLSLGIDLTMTAVPR